MLFNKFVTVSAIATLAAATAIPRDGASNQCCQQVQSVQQANSSGLSGLLSLLGVVLGDITLPIGLNCSPITVIGGGNGGCNTNTVNCQGTAAGGLIGIGCLPIQI
ncbi:fungal hydrophobin [Marasmius fiardii PR-910]|nr:fungal hydrophobin [Marasmius fiardii PR-910]